MAVATGKSFASRFGVHIAVLIFVVDLDHPDARHPGLVAARQGPDHRLGLVELVLQFHPDGSRPAAGRLGAGREGRQVRHSTATSSATAPARNISAFGVKSAAPTQYPAGDTGRSRRRRDPAAQCRRHLRHDARRRPSKATAASASTMPRRRRRNSPPTTTRPCCFRKASAGPS